MNDDNVSVASLFAERVERMEDKLDKIADALNKLAALEMQHIETRDALRRAFEAIAAGRAQCISAEKELAERILKLELQMPEVKRMSGLMFSALVGAASLLAIIVIKATGFML